MRFPRPLLALAITFWITVSTSVCAIAQFDGMLSRVPNDANTLIMIDAEKLFGSPLADRERWDARRKAAFEAGVSALPPDASAVLLASRTDYDTSRNLWELTLTRFSGGRDVASVAKRFGGSIDTIEGRTATRLPSNHYVVQISPNLLGSHTPASRQDVTRWLASTDKTSLTQSMSPYLMTAHRYATKIGTPIVMAVDVSGVFSADEATARLSMFESLGADKSLASSLGKLAGGIQGATLGITINNTAVGAVRVDFKDSLQAFVTVLKPVLLEVLQRHGAMVDDFETWEPSVQDNTFMLKGPLSTTGQAALWYGKYALKLDNLPILGVDPTLLSFGADIAGRLRDAQSSLRGVGMRTSVRTMSNNNGSSAGGPPIVYGGYFDGYGYGYGGFSYSYYDLRSGARAQDKANAAIRMEERVSGVANIQSIWKNIDEATAMIRREMTQKYEVEF